MKLSDNWFTTVTESDNGAVMFVSGRDEIDAFMESGKLRERVEITWPYESDAQGMPTEEESMRMEAPQEALRKAMEKDKLAILTGIYTGDGARTWVFYTRNIPAFGERLIRLWPRLNSCPLPSIPKKMPSGTNTARCVRSAATPVATFFSTTTRSSHRLHCSNGVLLPASGC